jgi:HPt (histidine-containing phosphotransfer) domain-containing protein
MDNSIIALERIGELRRYDTEESPFVDELLSACLETARQTSFFLKAHVADRDKKLLNSKAHAARGSCLDAGYNRLAAIFGRIENAATKENFTLIECSLPDLQRTLEITEQALRQLQNDKH